MRQVLFELPIFGGVPIYGFGVMLFLAFVSCLWLAKRRATKVGIERTVIEDLALWLFGGGILGARLCYLFLQKDALRDVDDVGDFLVKLVSIWDGGIILYGSVIGATASYFVGWYLSFRKKENVTTLRLADVIAPTAALGLILGRLGCLLNGCCYGQVACETCPRVSYPVSAQARYELTALGYQTPAGFLLGETNTRVLAVEPDSAAADAGLHEGDMVVAINGQAVNKVKVGATEVSPQQGARLLLTQLWPRGRADLTLTVLRTDKEGHPEEIDIGPFEPRTIPLQPTQLYESISMALVLLVLLTFDSVRSRDGQSMALLAICYGIHRFVNEILRIDQRPGGFERYISVLIIAGGVAWMLWLSLRKLPPAPSRPATVKA